MNLLKEDIKFYWKQLTIIGKIFSFLPCVILLIFAHIFVKDDDE